MANKACVLLTFPCDPDIGTPLLISLSSTATSDSVYRHLLSSSSPRAQKRLSLYPPTIYQIECPYSVVDPVSSYFLRFNPSTWWACIFSDCHFPISLRDFVLYDPESSENSKNALLDPKPARLVCDHEYSYDDITSLYFCRHCNIPLSNRNK